MSPVRWCLPGLRDSSFMLEVAVCRGRLRHPDTAGAGMPSPHLGRWSLPGPRVYSHSLTSAFEGLEGPGGLPSPTVWTVEVVFKAVVGNRGLIWPGRADSLPLWSWLQLRPA